MKKAILIIDMPESCEECELSRYSRFGLRCDISNEKGLIFKRPKWCPLRLMPQKKMPKHGEAFPQDMRLVDQWRGYDMCIDEILGEKDEH